MEEDQIGKFLGQLEEEFYILQIDESIRKAGLFMDLADLPEDSSEEDYADASEARFHCGTCVVSSVMEIIWPSVENYIEFLKIGSRSGNNNG